MVIQWNSSGISSQDSPHCSSATKSKSSPEKFTGRIIFMSMFNDISCGSKDNEKECESNAQLVSLCAKRFGAGQWSFLGSGSKKKWYPISEDSPQGEWDRIAEQMMLTFAESTHPVFRSTSPLSRGVLKSKGGGKLSIHYCADSGKIETVFRTITSVNQLSLYGAVAEMCEEYESLHERTVQPGVGGQSSSSIVPRVIKTEVLLDCDDRAHKDLLLQQYGERIEKLSQHDKLSKFCKDAGFLNVVEIGHHFMTKDTAEFSQFTDAVSCREYTLPREESLSEPKGWIPWNTKIGPVVEVTTCCLQGKYGVEIRIESMNKDNSHSWVRISHGLNKMVTNLNNKNQDDNDQETSEMQFEDCALRLNASDFASRSKDKTKPQRRTSASLSPKTIPIGERTWTDIEPQEYSLSDYSVSKKLINLLRHGSLPREDDGAIDFWRIKDHLQNHFVFCHHWSDEKWKSSMAGGRGNKKRYQYCTDSSRETLYVRALQGHSGRNPVDPSLQDNVLIPDGYFKYIYHVGCTINLHSIINSGLILGGQSLSKRQTIFFLPVDPMDKEHKDPETIDLGAPRLARYMHKARKKHQNTVYWVDIKLAQKKGIEVLSDAIECHHPLPYTPSLLYPEELFGWKLEKSCTKKYMNHLDCLRRFPSDMIG